MADPQNRVRRVLLSWRRWSEYDSWRPRIDRGSQWTIIKWAWFYLSVERGR